MQYVYVGDTGELDQEAGETMLREYPEVVQAVFLHCVSSDPPSSYVKSGLTIPECKLINGRPLIFFRTYVGAAAKATQLGLMDSEGLMKVMDAAEKELVDRNLSRGDSKWIDLERDIEDAYRTLSVVLG
jgi:phosphatidate phosphatase APP1